MSELTTVVANPVMIKMFAERTKCWMCKHKFSKPVILPVENPHRGKFQPNINGEVLFHIEDTHGVPHDAVTRMVINSVYGIENTLESVYGERK